MAAALLTGEENADEMRSGRGGKPDFLSNHAGGILGGISTGQPIVVRFSVKPTSSILTPRKTIDIEGNDYHVWASVRRSPRVVVIDFNPTVSNDVLLVQQDDPSVHDGASLLALIELGKAMGYELAAATTWNAVFVRTDQFPKLGLSDNGIDRMYYPVFETRVFWSINSYLNVSGCTRLIRHNYAFHPDQLQPVPPDLRNLPYKDGLDGAFLSTFF